MAANDPQRTMSDSEIKATPTAVAIKPTAVWTPLPLEDEVPPPYNTPRLRYEVTPLHPTFACELKGVDWNKPISPEEYEEIRRVTDKVSGPWPSNSLIWRNLTAAQVWSRRLPEYWT